MKLENSNLGDGGSRDVRDINDPRDIRDARDICGGGLHAGSPGGSICAGDLLETCWSNQCLPLVVHKQISPDVCSTANLRNVI